MKRILETLNTDQMNKIGAVILAVFLFLGGILFWQGEIGGVGFILFALFTLVVACLLVFDSRLSQKDGFLDGYNRAKNDLKDKKEE